jgi:TonB family protein
MIPLRNPQLAMTFLFGCTVKSTIVLAIGWIAAALSRSRSAAFRHNLWTLAIVGSFALPVLSLLLPAWHPTTLGQGTNSWFPTQLLAGPNASYKAPGTVISASTSLAGRSGFVTIFLAMWALGFCVASLRLAGGLVRLAWLSANSTTLADRDWLRFLARLSDALQIRRPVRLLQGRNPATVPLTWGVLRPVILLPATARDWGVETRRIVLSHELAHIARTDWFFQICAELLRAVYWFNPVVWLAAKRLRYESEQACDDSVVASGIEPSCYADQLLALARTFGNSHGGTAAALAIARPSHLQRRFSAMLNPLTNRRSLSSRAKVLTVFAALLLSLPLAALRLPAQVAAGAFTGAIYDPSGAAVPAATVIMTNRKANTIDMTSSDSQGNFSFAALPAGEYEMRALKPGFEEFRIAQIVLVQGRESVQNITLNVGSIRENMEVVANGTAKVQPSGVPGRVRVGGEVQAAKIITRVMPHYPAAAKAAGVEGTVILHAVIGKDGAPLSLRVMSTQVDPELARASVEAVSKWRYQPTLLNGEPIEVDTNVTVIFKLAD